MIWKRYNSIAHLTPQVWDKYISHGHITLESRLIALAERVSEVPFRYYACYESATNEQLIALFVVSFDDDIAYLATNETSGRHYWFDESCFDFCKFTDEVVTLLSADDYNCNKVSFEALSQSDISAGNDQAQEGWITSSITLDHEAKSLEQYILSLKSKQRNDMRKYRSTITAHNITCRVVEDYSYMENSYYPLYIEVSQRADEYTPEPYTVDYFRAAKEIFGDDAVMVSMFDVNDELLGYMFTLSNSTGCVMQYTGFKQDRELYLWHNLTLETIGYAIEKGLTYVDMGITNHRAKRQFGAQNHQTYSLTVKI